MWLPFPIISHRLFCAVGAVREPPTHTDEPVRRPPPHPSPVGATLVVALPRHLPSPTLPVGAVREPPAHTDERVRRPPPHPPPRRGKPLSLPFPIKPHQPCSPRIIPHPTPTRSPEKPLQLILLAYPPSPPFFPRKARTREDGGGNPSPAPSPRHPPPIHSPSENTSDPPYTGIFSQHSRIMTASPKT